MRTRDGREIWVRDEAILGTDHDGTLVLEGLSSDITARRKAEERLYWQVEHDQLTGLHNRTHFEQELATWLAGLAGPGRAAAVILLDIDDFKLLNDSLGHVAGDEVIRGVAEQLAARTRGEHPLARFSGDEFAVLVRDVDDARALAIAEELLDCVRSQAMRLPITASAGVAVFSEREITTGDVLVAADIALHQAKDAGRDRAELFTGERGERLTGVERVRAALDEERLVLDSQPIVDLGTGELVQEELLVRMRDERGEIVPPSSFLPAAERFGLIRDIDRWVVQQGIGVAATGRRVEINLSAR